MALGFCFNDLQLFFIGFQKYTSFHHRFKLKTYAVILLVTCALRCTAKSTAAYSRDLYAKLLGMDTDIPSEGKACEHWAVSSAALAAAPRLRGSASTAWRTKYKCQYPAVAQPGIGASEAASELAVVYDVVFFG
jgi:hypothetical protein